MIKKIESEREGGRETEREKYRIKEIKNRVRRSERKREVLIQKGRGQQRKKEREREKESDS